VRRSATDAYLDGRARLGIKFGLEAMQALMKELGHPERSYPTLLVAGTNGKGSVAASVDAVLCASGLRAGLYTSPHLVRVHERIRVLGAEITGAALARCVRQVRDAAERLVGLGVLAQHPTYFEVLTAAAFDHFRRQRVDLAVLEVGLGGRLDAVNAFDCDVAVIASVDLDHMEYLGDTREKIAFEKAGIFRRGKPAVVAEPDCPHSMTDHAAQIGAHLLLIDRDFDCAGDANQWRYRGPGGTRGGLPFPALRGEHQLRNAAAALTALDTLRERLPLSMLDIRRGLLETDVAGRFQVLPGRPTVILDVAHNPHAARSLAENLKRMGLFRETVAVFGMLKDKDIAGVVDAVKGEISFDHTQVDDFVVLRSDGSPTYHLASTVDDVDFVAFALVFGEHFLHDSFGVAAEWLDRNERVFFLEGFLHRPHYLVDDQRGIPSDLAFLLGAFEQNLLPIGLVVEHHLIHRGGM
jgi:dihydrofolate synthase/folylpolyglutamate synthase